MTREASVFTPRITAAEGGQPDSALGLSLEVGTVTRDVQSEASNHGSRTWDQVSEVRTLVCVCSLSLTFVLIQFGFGLGSENESGVCVCIKT